MNWTFGICVKHEEIAPCERCMALGLTGKMLWHLTVAGASESDGPVPEEDRAVCVVGQWVFGESGVTPDVFVAELPVDCRDPSRAIRERAYAGADTDLPF